MGRFTTATQARLSHSLTLKYTETLEPFYCLLKSTLPNALPSFSLKDNEHKPLHKSLSTEQYLSLIHI